MSSRMRVGFISRIRFLYKDLAVGTSKNKESRGEEVEEHETSELVFNFGKELIFCQYQMACVQSIQNTLMEWYTNYCR